MTPVLHEKIYNIETFEAFRKEAISEVKNNYPLCVHMFLDVFPDITVILSWPVVKDFPVIKKISKNLDTICISIIITSLATGSFGVIGLFYSAGALKYTFIAIHISSQSAFLLLSGGYIKKYFLLQKKHAIVEGMIRKLHGLQTLNTKYRMENEEHKAANSDLKTTIDVLRDKFKQQLTAYTSLESKLQEITAENALTVQNLKEQNLAISKIVEELKNAPGNLKLLREISQELSTKVDALKQEEKNLKKENEEKRLQNEILKGITVSLVLEKAKLEKARELLLEVVNKIHTTTCGSSSLDKKELLPTLKA